MGGRWNDAGELPPPGLRPPGLRCLGEQPEREGYGAGRSGRLSDGAQAVDARPVGTGVEHPRPKQVGVTKIPGR